MIAATWSQAISPDGIPPRFRSKIIRSRVTGIRDKLLALTFDDGPDSVNTPRILDALRHHHAHATFFVLGAQARLHPELVRRIVSEGHALGSHSWSHPSRVSPQRAREEVESTEALLKKVTGQPPILFRPPYGILKNGLASVAQKKGNAVILWTISSADTRPISTRQIADNIIHTPDSGDIALMHDGPGHIKTAEAVPTILDELGRSGWRFVTVPQLLTSCSQQASHKSR